MRITLIDNGTSYLADLEALLAAHETTTIPLEAADALKPTDADLIVLSGGHRVWIDDDAGAFAPQRAMLRTWRLPIIGICAGFELIAQTFGGTFQRMPFVERGTVEIDVLDDDPVFDGVARFRAYECHRLSLSATSPVLLPLARSRDGIEAIRHRERPVYGFQFHPEETQEVAGHRILARTISQLSRAPWREAA